MVIIIKNFNLIGVKNELEIQQYQNECFLDLSGNQLPFLVDIFPIWTQNIQCLKLDNSFLTILHEKVFMNLRNLEHLSLEGNLLTSIPMELLHTCTKLKTLSIKNNLISSFSTYKIGQCKDLQELDLGLNRINIFVHFTHFRLEVLKINFNLLTSFELNYCPQLKILELNGNRIRTLKYSWFEKLTLLNDLDVSNNCIASIDIQALKSLTQLQKLSLNRNKLLTFSTAILPPKIKYLDLEWNYISHINFRKKLDQLEYLNVAQNTSIHKIPLELTENLRYLNLNYTSITSTKSYAQFYWLIAVKHLEHLSYTNNNLLDFDTLIFRYMEKLKFLSLDNNNSHNRTYQMAIEQIENNNEEPSVPKKSFHRKCLNVSMFTERNILRKLSMQNCEIQKISLAFFKHFVLLINLNLSENFIGFLPELVFDSLASLKFLNLSSNVIEGLHANIFMNNLQLKYVNLRVNLLTLVRKDIFTKRSIPISVLTDEHVKFI